MQGSQETDRVNAGRENTPRSALEELFRERTPEEWRLNTPVPSIGVPMSAPRLSRNKHLIVWARGLGCLAGLPVSR
jgi:hypothetical protein